MIDRVCGAEFKLTLGSGKQKEEETVLTQDSFRTNIASSRTKVIAAKTATTSTYVWVLETELLALVAAV